VLAAAHAGINSPLTSSAGRLFDAVASIVGLRDEVTYEGQAAVDLEQCAAPGDHGTYSVDVREGDPLVADTASLVRAVAEDVARGVPASTVSARFHTTLAHVVVDVCARLRAARGLSTVALSGGVFQNVRLLELCIDELEATGFEVLTHGRVPPNDGGISLGQAVVAAARDRATTA
jgi:hydrogenase maturation protein HypF